MKNGVLTGFNGIQRLPGDFTMKKGWNQPFYRGFGGYQSQNRVYGSVMVGPRLGVPQNCKMMYSSNKNGGIPPKTLENQEINQVDSVRMWTKDIPQLLFCFQTVHTTNTFISWPSAGMGPQFKILVRIQNAGQGPRISQEVSGWPWGRGQIFVAAKTMVELWCTRQTWLGSVIFCVKNGCAQFFQRLE